MTLQIVIESLDPPTGHAVVDGRATWGFVGWLELMRALEQLEATGAGAVIDDDVTASPH